MKRTSPLNATNVARLTLRTMIAPSGTDMDEPTPDSERDQEDQPSVGSGPHRTK
jgi:hypothetical protein